LIKYDTTFHLKTILAQNLHECCLESPLQENIILSLSNKNAGCDNHLLILNVSFSTWNYPHTLVFSFIYFKGNPAPHAAPVVLLLLQTL
jgi:hypothetical protein